VLSANVPPNLRPGEKYQLGGTASSLLEDEYEPYPSQPSGTVPWKSSAVRMGKMAILTTVDYGASFHAIRTRGTFIYYNLVDFCSQNASSVQ
jgi:hypothetical protein